MSSYPVYFGGSRHLQNHPKIAPVVATVLAGGGRVHVGCQNGADRLVIEALPRLSNHRIFAVFDLHQYPYHHHIPTAYRAGYQIAFGAGGPATIPAPARFLRRSIAAFQGCRQAVFFEPGPGSFAVMREFISQYPAAPVFVFGPQPAPMFGGCFQLVLFQLTPLACWQFQPQQNPLF